MSWLASWTLIIALLATALARDWLTPVLVSGVRIGRLPYRGLRPPRIPLTLIVIVTIAFVVP